MKCPDCVKEGKTSKVFDHGGSTTCMGWTPYWDEGGTYHSHDPNTHASSYSCSNGHIWVEKNRAQCPATGCDYGRTKPVAAAEG